MKDKELSESLERLEILTNMLPSFPREVEETSTLPLKCVKHEMACGTSLSWCLYSSSDVSVWVWFNSNGTVFQKHTHGEREWIIVFRGSMILTSGDWQGRLLVGQSYTNEPGTEHGATFPEDCWYLAVTVPQSKDWNP